MPASGAGREDAVLMPRRALILTQGCWGAGEAAKQLGWSDRK